MEGGEIIGTLSHSGPRIFSARQVNVAVCLVAHGERY
jgi:hypothetical protein